MSGEFSGGPSAGRSNCASAPDRTRKYKQCVDAVCNNLTKLRSSAVDLGEVFEQLNKELRTIEGEVQGSVKVPAEIIARMLTDVGYMHARVTEVSLALVSTLTAIANIQGGVVMAVPDDPKPKPAA